MSCGCRPTRPPVLPLDYTSGSDSDEGDSPPSGSDTYDQATTVPGGTQAGDSHDSDEEYRRFLEDGDDDTEVNTSGAASSSVAVPTGGEADAGVNTLAELPASSTQTFSIATESESETRTGRQPSRGCHFPAAPAVEKESVKFDDNVEI